MEELGVPLGVRTKSCDKGLFALLYRKPPIYQIVAQGLNSERKIKPITLSGLHIDELH